MRSGIHYITSLHAVVSYPRPLLYDLTNCTNVARYSPSSIRPDSTFPNFSAQQCLQQRGETLKTDYYSQVTRDLGGGMTFQKRISKIVRLMCSPELGPSHFLIFPQMCAGWVKGR